MKHPSYEEVAKDFHLWVTYVDPHGTISQEEFDEMSTEEKIQIQIGLFSSEESEETDMEKGWLAYLNDW